MDTKRGKVSGEKSGYKYAKFSYASPFHFSILMTIAIRTISDIYTTYATPESTAPLTQGQATETLTGSNATDTLESTVVETNTPEFTPTETATQTETGTPKNTPTPAATILSTPIHSDILQWILSDHLGSTSTTANADGSLNSTIQYTAFGEIRLTQGVTPTKYRLSRSTL